MRLVVKDLTTAIDGSHPAHILDPVTSYFVDGAWFAPSYRKGQWDGFVRFIKTNRKTKQKEFPTGMLGRVTRALNEANWKYTVEDLRNIVIPEPQYELNGITLYDYQQKVVDDAVSFGRGILQAPTGSGKTEIGAALIKTYGKRALWLTHRRTLLYQTHARLEERLGHAVGIVGDGRYDLTSKVTVAMVQSLGTVLDKFQDVQLLIGDEVHHLTSDQWYDNFAGLPAPYRFGLSATPTVVGEGLSLVAMCGDVISEVPIQMLIDRKKLVQPKIWFVTVDEPQLPKKAAFATVYSEGIVNNASRNTRVVQVCKQLQLQRKPALVLVKRINHGQLLADLLSYASIRTTFIQGSSSIEDRQASLAQLADGSLDAVVAMVEIFGEGTDIPFLRAVVNATGGKGGGNAAEGDSGRLTIQILGRGIRTAPGKTEFDYIDFADRTHKMLKEASLARLETLEHEGYGDFIQDWSSYSPLEPTS